MSNYCMIETAFDDKTELTQVVDELLNNKLVASCQVVESDSKWRWKNELENSKEYLVFMKTKKELAKEIFETYHSQIPADFSVHSRETCFPCTASTFKPRIEIDTHHGGRGTALWESLEGKPQIP